MGKTYAEYLAKKNQRTAQVRELLVTGQLEVELSPEQSITEISFRNQKVDARKLKEKPIIFSNHIGKKEA